MTKKRASAIAGAVSGVIGIQLLVHSGSYSELSFWPKVIVAAAVGGALGWGIERLLTWNVADNEASPKK